MNRVSLIDPLLYQSSYVNNNTGPSIWDHFWKKFNLLNFIFNIIIPVTIVIFILFVLKEKYMTKIKTEQNRYKDNHIYMIN